MHKLAVNILAVMFICMHIYAAPLCYAAAGERCQMCGMDSSRSQTEYIVYWSNDRKETACSLHCVYLLQSFYSKDRSVAKLETRDFYSGEFIDAKKAFYLKGSSIIPKGSMAPFLPAFSDKERAQKYGSRYGGIALDYGKAMDIVKQFDDEVGGK